MDEFQTLPHPTICQLASPLLSGFTAPLFRRAAGDGVPVLVVRMGDREGVVPLRALQRSLGIPDDSPDGMMLGRIGEALDFVNELRPGDPLPAEVLTGDASWQPDAVHRHIAAHLLRGRLIQWLRVSGVPNSHMLEEGDFDRADRDPAASERLNHGFSHVARHLNVPDAVDVVVLLEALIAELSYIEALRERLLHPLRHLARKLDMIGLGRRGDSANTETLTLVRRLCQIGLERIGGRIGAVDRITEHIVPALAGGAGQQMLIRSSRDWLYRTQIAFAPVLEEWEAAPTGIDENFWARLGRCHRFLAPRFMAVQQWKLSQRPEPGRKGSGPRMGW